MSASQPRPPAPGRGVAPAARAARVAVIIPAAGQGLRMGRGRNKVLLPLGGRAMLWWTLARFLPLEAVARIVVVHGPAEGEAMRQAAPPDPQGKLRWARGGAQRQESVGRALAVLEAQPPHWVLVHDGARPLASAALIHAVLEALAQHGAVSPALEIVDALRRMQGGRLVLESRQGLLAVQTPQGFHWELLKRAHAQAAARGLRGLDDAQLVESLGEAVHFIPGERLNLKLTQPGDLPAAERLLAAEEA